jgi:hypothetical protein
LSKPQLLTRLDDSHQSAYLSFDPDTRLLFAWGKGDAAVTVFEHVNGSPNFIEYVHTFQHKEGGLKGFDLMPKRVIEPGASELFRAVRLHDKSLSYGKYKNNIKSGFHAEFYPPYFSGQPSHSYDEWAKGSDKESLR